MMQAATANAVKGSLSQFYARNDTADLRYAKLFDPDHLDALSWRAGERDRLLGSLRSMARLTPSPQQAAALVQAGFASAHRVAGLTASDFATQMRGTIDAGSARLIHGRARGVRACVLQRWMQLREAASPYNRILSARERRRTVGAADSAPVAAGISVNYKSIFGEAAESDIPHDASIMGPGAYLADLLAIVQRAITEPSFEQPDDPLTLARRRPDLQNLLLTPANASDEISNIELILEVLESSLGAFAQTGATIATPAYPSGQPALAQVVSQWPTPVQSGTVYTIVGNNNAVTISAPTTLTGTITIRSGPSLQSVSIAAPIVVGSSGGSVTTAVVLEGFNFTLGGNATAMIEFKGGSLVLRDCIFSSPRADVSGGWAVLCDSGASGTIRVDNCTFMDTSAAPSEPAIAAGNSGALTLSISDCIVWPQAAPAAGYFVEAPTNAVNVEYCDIRGGKSGIAGATRVNYADTNFDEDPRFTSSLPPFLPFDPASPCIGRGSDGCNVGAVFDIYDTLAWAAYPPSLPFDLEFVTGQLALAAMEVDLRHVDRALDPIVSGVRGQNLYFSLSRLGISLADYQVLTTRIVDEATLAPYFGLPASPTAFADAAVQFTPSAPNAFAAADVASWVGLTPDGLRDLIYEDLSAAEIAQGIQFAGMPAVRGWQGFYVNGQGDAQCNTLALVTQFVPVGRNALLFDSGSNTSIKTTSISGVDSFTICVWMYQAAGQQAPAFILTVGNAISWQIDGVTLTINLTAGGTSQTIQVDLSAFAADPQWMHLATTYDALAATFNIYVNGALAASRALSAPGPGWVTGAVMTLGGDQSGNNCFSGVLCELTVWECASSAEQITAAFQTQPMTAVKTSPPPGLLLYVPVNDGTGVNVTEWYSGTSLAIAGTSPTWIYTGLPSQKTAAGAGISAAKDGVVFAQMELLIGRVSGLPSAVHHQPGVTTANLDRINRFARLARRLNWSFAELDWALFTVFLVNSVSSPTDISGAAAPRLFADLARLSDVMARVNLAVREACALFGPLKPFGRGRFGDQLSLFDEVFNRPPLAGAAFAPDMSLTLSVVNDFEKPGPIARRLAAMLSLGVGQLASIVRSLAPAGAFKLTGTSLTALYRYRLLAGWLSLDVDSFADLLFLTSLQSLSGDCSPADFDAFLRTADWIKQSGFNPPDLRYLIAPRGSTPTDPYQSRVQLEITQKLPKLKADLGQATSPWLVGPQSFISPIVNEVQSLKMYQDALSSGYIHESGLITSKLWARLPLAPYRVPSDAFKTIGDAVNAAVAVLDAGVPAATVLIAPGTYEQDGDHGLAIALRRGVLTLQAEADATTTIIDCKKKGRFLAIENAGGGSVVINGLTIRNGASQVLDGGAIYSACAVQITNCILRDNSVRNGGAVCIAGSAPPVNFQADNCVFYGNIAASNGGALYLKGSAGSLYFCTACGNSNIDGTSNGVYLDRTSTLEVSQSILWNKTNGHSDWNEGARPACEYSDININQAPAIVLPPGCICAEPKLRDPTNGIYELAPDSPCRGRAKDGGDIGFGGSTQQDLTALALFPFAYAQIGALQKALSRFFDNDVLPFDVVLGAIGPYENGLEILLFKPSGTAALDYLRDVYRYLLLASLFGLDGRTLSQVFSDPTLFSLTGSGNPPVPTLRDLALLARFGRLRTQYPDAVEGLLSDVVGSSGSGAAGTLATLFGWNEADIAALLDADRIADFLTATSDVQPAYATATIQHDAAPLTVEAWISTNTVNDGRLDCLLAMRNTGWSFVFQVIGSGQVQLQVGDNSHKFTTVVSQDPLQRDRWYHVAGVVDSGAGTLTLFVDGQQAAQGATTIVPVLAAGDAIDLGQDASGGDAYKGIANSLAEVRVWSVVRSPGEIRANMRRRIPSADPDFVGLCGYWTFEHGSAADVTGNWGNAATPNAGVTFSQFPAHVAMTAVSGDNPAYATGQITYDGDPPYSNSLSVEAWVSTDALANGNVLLGVRHTQWSFAFEVAQDGKLTFEIGSQDAKQSNAVTSSAALPVQTWCHVAGVFDGDGNTLALYINGEPAGSASTTIAPGLSSGDRIVLGQDDLAGAACSGFTNSLAEVRIWSVTRAQAQIQANMRGRIRESSPDFASLCGYWTFENGSIADLTDTWNHDLSIPHGGVTFARMPTPTPAEPVPFVSIIAAADAMALVQRSGLGARTLLSLYRNGLVAGADGAAPLVDAVTAADADKGAAVVASMTELKRDALKRFAIPQINAVTGLDFPVVTDDDLSDYLLLDVNMGVGTSTSRTVQATLSLQQYIQRCRLGLEPHAAKPNLTDKEWDWIRTYRTWEANRKVFLYPETYLRPELRNNKTPLFVDFEQGLSNSPMTKEGLEKLYRRYLDQFAVVASLETVGSWFEPGRAIDSVMTATSSLSPAYVTAILQGSTPPYSSALTVEAWISTTTPGSANVLFGVHHGTSWSLCFQLGTDGKLNFTIGSQGTSDQVVASEPLQAGTWYHVAGVLDNGTLSLYIDGQLAAPFHTTTVTPGVSSGDPIVLGQDNTGGAAYSGFVNSLAEVRIWNVARAPSDIQADMRGRVASSSPNYKYLVGYWTFEDNSIADLTGWWTGPSIPNGNVTFGPMSPPLDSSAQPDLYYFIGRTRTQPPTFYCRTMEMRAGQTPLWKPWEKIELSINASYATPVVFQGGLYLFWVELRKFDATTDGKVPEHYQAIIKYSQRNADGSWLAAQSPFPVIELPDGFLDPFTNPLWQKPCALPTINHGIPAIAVIYGAGNSGVHAPSSAYCAILNWDQTVVVNWSKTAVTPALSPDPNSDYPALANDGSSLWWLTGQSVLTAAGLHPWTFSEILAWDATGTIWYQTPGNQTFSPWSPSNPFNNNCGNVAFCQGALLATVAPTNSPVQLYRAAAPFTNDGSWTLINSNIAPAAFSRLSMLGSNGNLCVAFTTVAPMRTQFVKQKFDSLTESWGSPQQIYTADSVGYLTSDQSHTIYCVLYDNSSVYIYYSNSGGTTWTPTSPAGFQSPTVGSSPISWNGKWCLAVLGGNDSSVGIYTADSLIGTWTCVVTLGQGSANGVSLAATIDGMYCASGSSIWFTADPTLQTWTLLQPVSNNAVNLNVIAYESSESSLLTSLPPGATTAPVINQLSAATLSMSGASFLVQALDPTTGGVMNGQLQVTVQAGNQLSLGGNQLKLAAPRTPPDVSNASFRLRRLTSSAVQTLSRELATGGIDALLSQASQQAREFSISERINTSAPVRGPEQDTISFSLSDAYGMYYREIFFFIPWLIAEQLQKNGRFEDARKYLEYIFKPSAGAADKSYWQCLWLRDADTISMLDALENLDPAALAAYHDDPFDATAIADLRPSAYQRAIVTAYIQNLVAWGDSLFTQNTRETINEAELLYRYARDILGPRPRRKPYAPPAPRTYSDLTAQAENEFLMVLEALDAETGQDAPAPLPEGQDPSGGVMDNGFYFGVPDNPEFLGNWDTLDDRLYKIRNGLDISGKVDNLALFDPPLSVADIQRLGRSGGTAVAASGAAEHLWALEEQFSAMLYSARTLAGSLVDYGRSLQQALEAKDADGLFMLQSSQQSALADQMRQVRIEDVRSAQATLSSLQAALQSATYRRDYYKALQAAGWSGAEQDGVTVTYLSLSFRTAAASTNVISVPFWDIPTIVGTSVGGEQPGASIQAAASGLSEAASAYGECAGLSNTIASYERRQQDWQFQQRLAEFDLTQLTAQVDAATRQANSVQMQFDLEQAALEQARAVQQYYTNKFANGQLYDWMAETLSALHQQFYQIALSSAQTLQATLSTLTGIDQQFVTASGWNSQWRGLLAGEALQLDLARVEQAFNQWQRSQPTEKMQKMVSLRQLAPEAFRTLVTTGQCVFDLSHAAFDRDYPGHYLRTLSELSVQLPGVAEERHELHMVITRLSHDTVRQADAGAVRFLLGQTDASPGKALRRGLQPWRTAVSHAPMVDGREQLEFHSGPVHAFDGGGAVSRWQVEIPFAQNRVDLRAMRDLVLTVQYRARYGGDAFRRDVEKALPEFRSGLLVDVARDFPTLWNAHASAGAWQIELPVARTLMPRNLPGRSFRRSRISVEVIPEDGSDLTDSILSLSLPQAGGPHRATLQARESVLRVLSSDAAPADPLWTEPWRLAFEANGDTARVKNVHLFVEFDEMVGS